MKRHVHFLGMLGFACLAITTYQLVIAADPNAPGPTSYITRFTDCDCLVVFDLGSEGVERTVLENASLTGIGSKSFLSGVVTDKYPDFRVTMPGNAAHIALDRIVYVQVINKPQEKNAKQP